jgi:hypothetical protein
LAWTWEILQSKGALHSSCQNLWVQNEKESHSHIPRIHIFESEKANVPKTSIWEDNSTLSSFHYRSHNVMAGGILHGLSPQQPAQPPPLFIKSKKEVLSFG